MTFELRPYQTDLIQQIAQHFRNGSRAPLAQGPTGMGKTVIMTTIADGAARKGNRCAVLVHRQELVTQTAVALARAGVWHGICAPSSVVAASVKAQIAPPSAGGVGRSFFNQEAGVIVASVQTLARRLDQFGDFRFLFLDEAHHAVAGQWAQVIGRYPSAYICGFTATPERLDGKGLGISCGGPFSSLVLGPSVSALIGGGYLSRPRVFAPPVQLDLSGVHTVAGDYNKGELSETMDRPAITGDAIEHYRRLCDGKPAVAFCVGIDHAKHVAEQFRAAGYRASCIDGTMDDTARRHAIADLAGGRLNILTSCEIINEGTDIPVIAAAILLRPTQSLGLYLQQVGRALRPYPGKEHAIILDHVGNTDRHGLPDDDREWTLEGRKKKKRKAGESESGPSVRQCLICFAVYAAARPVCPVCGAAAMPTKREIEQREGQLVEIKKQEAAARAKREQGQARTMEELIQLAKARGYKNPFAWAKYIHSARHGVRL